MLSNGYHFFDSFLLNYWYHVFSMPIDFVYFDIGGVLLRWQHVPKMLMDMHEFPEQEFHSIFSTYDNLACTGKISLQESFEKMRQHIPNKNVQAFDYFGFVVNNFTPIKETHVFLRKVAERYPVGLLTNVQHKVYPAAINKGLVPDVQYAAVVQSCDVAVMKPSKEIYEIAQVKAGIIPEHILFIDDMQANIDAAVAQGWQGFVFDTDHPDESIGELKMMLRI